MTDIDLDPSAGTIGPADGITFFVAGAPYGKGRPRVSSFGGRARMYTPEKTVAYENLVRISADIAMGSMPVITGPVSVFMRILVPTPASMPKKRQKEAMAGLLMPTKKPDIDNVEKAIFDALNGVVWKDDVQVVDVTKSKRYSEKPGVWVVIKEIK